MKFRRGNLDICAEASGAVIVIDVLRAFTTAAVAFSRGAAEIVLVSTVEEAFALRKHDPHALLMGEVDFLPIEGFDLPNSPSTLSEMDLTSRRLIQRTTAGTQGATRSVVAEPLLVASLCVARATADYVHKLNPTVVTFIETGVRNGNSGEEDIACADYIIGLLNGTVPTHAEIEQRVRGASAAQKFEGEKDSVFPAADLEECLKVDCFDFAMVAKRQDDGVVVLKPTF